MRGVETLRWQRVLHEPSPANAERQHQFKLPEMRLPQAERPIWAGFS
jgi:hypothetical protein